MPLIIKIIFKMSKLKNKVAIITGASKGIGATDDAAWITGEQISVSGVIMVFKFINSKKLEDNETELLAEGEYI
jgi:NADP-dependent 3-hydroxy acid dehydrogenase YdfG